MATQSTLQSAQNGTIWARRVGDITYFLRKVNNKYEVWTSADSTHYTVSISDAVVYFNQHNLVNTNTESSAPIPPPVSAPKKTVSAPSPTPVVTKTTSKPASTTSPSNPTVSSSPETTTPSAISAIISNDEPIPINAEQLNADITASMAEIPIPDFSAVPIASQQDATQFESRSDWRVRLSLSPDCNYLYRSANPKILAPLAPKANGGTDGVIFPYTPAIAVNYAASYEPVNVVHSNYRVNQYTNSYIDSVTITGDFTAQDSKEANYLLAVIHFFRTMTKMFYGQDQDPKRGTPPPLCYLTGMGTFQFSAHPLAITGFSYNLPNDVDYIKTVAVYDPGAQQPSTGNNVTPSRMTGLNVGPGGKAKSPQFSGLSSNQTGEVTWVPTKIQLTITCIPMQSRNQVSNLFSLEKYATGDLLKGTTNPGGAFW